MSLTELTTLMNKKPTQATWRKVCEWLDACAPGDLDAAFDLIEGDAARWNVNTNKDGLWELPARYTPASWCKRMSAGDAPPGFRTVRLLQYHSVKLTDAGLKRILDTGALDSLTHLYLGSCQLGEGALHLLAEHADQLGALTHLVLCDNDLTSEGAEALLATSLPRHLVYVEVTRTGLDDSAVARLTKPVEPWR